MNTPISPELLMQIEKEAQVLYPFEHNFIDVQEMRRWIYKQGATAYAHYKEQFQQAKKALEEIAQMGNPRNRHQYKEFVARVITKSKNALSSWKEEGKGEESL